MIAPLEITCLVVSFNPNLTHSLLVSSIASFDNCFIPCWKACLVVSSNTSFVTSLLVSLTMCFVVSATTSFATSFELCSMISLFIASSAIALPLSAITLIEFNTLFVFFPPDKIMLDIL